MHRAATILSASALAVGLAGPAAAEPTEAQLADAVRLGTVATLAPLCGLRDEAWSADLRRATVQSVTGSGPHDDPSLRAAPGSNLAVSALSFAEAEALEDFAESAAGESCGRLAGNPDLPRGDAIVRAFRGQGPGS